MPTRLVVCRIFSAHKMTQHNNVLAFTNQSNEYQCANFAIASHYAIFRKTTFSAIVNVLRSEIEASKIHPNQKYGLLVDFMSDDVRVRGKRIRICGTQQVLKHLIGDCNKSHIFARIRSTTPKCVYQLNDDDDGQPISMLYLFARWRHSPPGE